MWFSGLDFVYEDIVAKVLMLLLCGLCESGGDVIQDDTIQYDTIR